MYIQRSGFHLFLILCFVLDQLKVVSLKHNLSFFVEDLRLRMKTIQEIYITFRVSQ